MNIYKLETMINGWFVGNFNPSVLKTKDVEVAVKKYKAGDRDAKHYHKVATEITVIVEGTVRMNDRQYSAGDILVIEPNEITDFMAVTDSITTVVKLPGANNDKYIVEEQND